MLHIRWDSSEVTSLDKMKNSLSGCSAGAGKGAKRRKKLNGIRVEWDELSPSGTDKDGERKCRDSQRNFVLPHGVMGRSDS